MDQDNPSWGEIRRAMGPARNTNGKAFQTPDQKRWYKYRLSPQRYNTILEDQGGLCPICLEGFQNRQGVVEYCHKTGRIRSIVHQVCHMLLGLAKDDTETLVRVIQYLTKPAISQGNNPELTKSLTNASKNGN